MSYEYSEDKRAQQTLTDFLQDELGWETAFAFDTETYGADGTFGRLDRRQVVLPPHLDAALRRLNPGYTNDVYEQALLLLIEYSTAQTLEQINREKYHFFREGVPVVYRDENGKEEHTRLSIFDFEDRPGSNHFLAVREMWVEGEFGRIRPDVIGFVNGIPLLFIECKNTHKSLKAAHNVNLAKYKRYTPQLFHHNAFVMLTNGIDSRVGSTFSPFPYFQEWKRLAEEDDGRVDLETMLRGICNRKNFLDIFENFILFDESKGEMRKILARNHQYLGVNRAYHSVETRHQRDGKLGVFWHTQGSGKSYSMIFLSRKIHRKQPGNFTFLVLTDREDLDDQIYKTFAGVGEVNNEQDRCRAGSGPDLRDLLGFNKRFVFSLVQKFNLTDPTIYSNRSDIIVISDEAHRTQYGVFARRMREVLPNASFIGFTGTPLIGGTEDELTKATFGDYISTYDFQRAVEDEATVPLYYDNRGEKMNITTESLNEEMAEVLESFDPDEDQESRLRRVLKSDYLIITKPERLERIAHDFVEHYTTRWETGKAMLVCIDKITAVKMHRLIDKYWQEKIASQRRRVRQATDEQDEIEQQRFLAWLEETQRIVVISEAADEVHVFDEWGEDIAPHRKIIKTRDLEEEFKQDTHPFRVAIVCAMWLTGFDVESLATLYIDKPMKGHTLMQAIARANRVKEGKPNGLIIDYNGLLKSLRKALSIYAAGQRDPAQTRQAIDPVKPEEDLLAAYAQDVQACIEYLLGLGYDLQDLIDADGFDKNEEIVTAAETVAVDDNTRAKFEVLAQQMFNKAKSLVSNRGLYRYKRQHDAIEAIYKRLKKTDDDPADIIDVLVELQKTIDEAVSLQPTERTDGKETETLYDMSKIDFNRLRREFNKAPRKNLTVQTLKQKVEAKLNRMVKVNPTRMDFFEHYQRIIEEYNNETDRATIEQTFEQLLLFVESLTEEENRAAREGLTEEQLAAFDLLSKDKGELPAAKREKIKHIAAELLAAIQEAVSKLDNWTEKEATKAEVKTIIHNYLYDDTTGLPDEFSEEEVDALTQDFFQYVIEQYASPNEYAYIS